MIRFPARYCVLVLFTGMIVQTSELFAQDVVIQARVVQLAGQNIFLDVGEENGIGNGDTLRVLRGNRVIGDLIVDTASSNQCMARFAGSTFALTRGSSIQFSRVQGAIHTEAPLDPVSSSNPAIEEQPSSILESTRGLRVTMKTAAQKIRLEGRVTVNMNLIHSVTTPIVETQSATSRLFITPAVTLNTSLVNLPSDVRVRLHARTDYRYSSTGILDRSNVFRAYQLRVDKEFEFGQVFAGRFYNYMIPHGGYWDGVTFFLGQRKRGIGAGLGYMPDRSNERFTTQFPRYSLFGTFETDRQSTIGYQTAVAYNEIMPAAVFLNHRFLDIEQRIRWEGLTISQDIQIDQDPVDKEWIVSLARINNRYSINNNLSLFVNYALRHPYRIYNISEVFSTRRDQVETGFNYHNQGYSIGGNFAVRYREKTYESQTITTYFKTPAILPGLISVSGSANVWNSDFGNALFLNAGLSRRFTHSNFLVNYSFYRSDSPGIDAPIDVHRYSLTFNLPLGDRLYWNNRIGFQQSQYLDSFNANTTLQVRF